MASWENFKRWTRYSPYKRLLPTGILSMLIICVVLPTIILFRRELPNHSLPKQFASNLESTSPVEIILDLLALDPITRKADFLVRVNPSGELVSNNGTLAAPININLMYNQKNYQAGQLTTPFVLTVPFMKGSLRDFPFDKFSGGFPVEVRQITETGSSVIIPTVTTYNHLQSYTSRFSHSNIESSPGWQLSSRSAGSLVIITDLSRPFTSIFLCLSLTILMWALTIVILALSWEVSVLGRALPTSLVAVGPAILFSLPAIRSAQPNIPDSSCLLDLMGFFWALGLVGIATVAMILAWFSNPYPVATPGPSTASTFHGLRWNITSNKPLVDKLSAPGGTPPLLPLTFPSSELRVPAHLSYDGLRVVDTPLRYASGCSSNFPEIAKLNNSVLSEYI